MKNKQHDLFGAFKHWMENNGIKAAVSSSYVSYLRTLLDKLYRNGYSVVSNPEELFNSADGYPQLMKGLLEYFNDAIQEAFADANCPISPKQLNNGRSAFRKFVEFILGYVGAVKVNTQNVVQSAPKPTVTNIKPTKVYQTMMGWETYSHKELVNKIKSRLGSQDRISGDKVWLPMRVIIALLGTRWFKNWSDDIIDKIKVLVENGSVLLNQVEKLLLKPDYNDYYSVWVIVVGEEKRVYTHTSEKELIPMLVKGIDKVSLEHTTSIDHTLRKLGDQNSLSELSKISDIAEKVSKTIVGRITGNSIKQKITVKQDMVSSNSPNIVAIIDLIKLIDEMNHIKDDTDYELMDGSQNSSKGKKK